MKKLICALAKLVAALAVISALLYAAVLYWDKIMELLCKVRSLLGTDLNDADERTRYRMAFYIKDILEKQAKKYERKEGPSLRGPHSHE